MVRYLPQNPVFDPEMTVLDSVLTQCVLNFVGSGRTERTDADAHAQEQKWSLEERCKKHDDSASALPILHRKPENFPVDRENVWHLWQHF